MVGTRGRSLRQKQTIEECYFLASLPWVAQFAFIYNIEQMSWHGISHHGLDVPASVINEFPIDMPTGESDRGSSVARLIKAQRQTLGLNLKTRKTK